jgi:micrococcal nuclease
MRGRRWQIALFGAVAAAALVLGSTLNGGVGGVGHTLHAPDPRVARVVEVVDGETIRVRFVSGTERTVHYIGIDAPATPATGEPLACFGRRATRENTALTGVGHRVRLEYDRERYDTQGALQAYVFRTVDMRFVNLEMLRGGFATVLTEPPNVRHVAQLMPAGRAAREARRGLWRACRTQGS